MSDMNSRYTRRLQKELMDIQKNPPPGIAVEEVTSLHKWRIHAEGAQGSVYAGEKFELQFIFPQNYPLEAPEVIFVGNHIPIHPHVYSNGHICLSILYDGWSPALSVTSVVLSILSMLSSCTDKQRPPDNDTYIKNAIGRSPKDTRWWFHDDSV
eukprot:Phypoly_transcript_09984.p1 GENE.Phypoly_transcript_09984~~Phypoly_transcript_09984.p1  ORF type:complete len:154 (-),score=5.15 Phypoly_transcript_09984:800-1261(-)